MSESRLEAKRPQESSQTRNVWTDQKNMTALTVRKVECFPHLQCGIRLISVPDISHLATFDTSSVCSASRPGRTLSTAATKFLGSQTERSGTNLEPDTKLLPHCALIRTVLERDEARNVKSTGCAALGRVNVAVTGL